MSKRISVICCMLLVVSMVFSIVGCSQSPAQSSTSASGQASSAATSTPGQPVTLEFWDMAWGPAGVYDTVAQKLTQKYTSEVAPNVTINYTNLPWTNWFEQFSTAVASNSAPDVCTGGGYMPFQFASSNEMGDLKWIVDQWKADGTDKDFLPGMMEYWQWKGKQVGIPWNYDPRVAYIRVDWLKDKGLSMPKTWDELINVCKAFTDKSKGIYGLCFGVTSNSAGPFSNFATGNGGFAFNADGTANMNSDHNLQTMRFFNTMKQNGCLPEGIENYTGDDAMKLMEANKCGVFIGGAGNFHDMLSAGMTIDQLNVMPPPQTPSGTNKYQLCTNAYMMFASTKAPEESLKFLKWFSENGETLFTDGQLNPFPARTSGLNNKDFNKEEWRKQIIDNVLSANCVPMVTPMNHGTPSASDVEGEKFDMVCMQSALTQDEAGWKSTLNDLQTQLTGIIANMDK